MTAYLVLDFSVQDLPGFKPYIAEIPTFIEKHGGRYIVRGVEPTIMEGDWAPEHMVILEFPSRQNALFAVRHKTTISKLVLVDGCI